MSVPTVFVDIILPLPLHGLFTYRVPRDMADHVLRGKRVVVQFGKKKLYTGIIHTVHDRPPQIYQAKYVLDMLDDRPVVTEAQLTFWEWMRDYYMCHLGDVMQAAIPSGLKLSSETRVCVHPDYAGETEDLDDEELQVLDALHRQEQLSMEELAVNLGKHHVLTLIRRMSERRLVMQVEELQEKFKPRTRTVFSLLPEFLHEQAMEAAFVALARAPKQLDALMQFIQISRFDGYNRGEVSRERLVDDHGISPPALAELVKRGVLLREEVEVARLADTEAWAEGPIILTEGQETARQQIEVAFEEDRAALLFGVTGSGKTEVYIRIIDEILKQGRQVLYLLPEIALTTQIISRLRKHFGERVGVYHSRISDNERVEVWKKQMGPQPYEILLGARSAMFLPFQSLGLVIVDEEHEQTFKQHDPAPRYHARDSAAMLARREGAKLLLGSATPSVEAYHNALLGKFVLVPLKDRFGGIRMPQIIISDLAVERKNKTMKGPFSELLLQNMRDTLARGEQVIIFQNRRGFSSFVQCAACGHVPDCERCDITLTYHKHSSELRCHYCGFLRPMPRVCPKCLGTFFRTIGFGTEQIEEELELLFPGVGIARMDLDTTRGKHAYLRIISDFEERRVNILVGTQMVTKGLDFDHVGLVGVLNADQLLNYPDFRAFERAYQLMAQVSGRAGRRKRQGKVVIQTTNPTHFIIDKVVQNDYVGMFENELQQRKQFRYPPFVKMIRITVRHTDRDKVEQAADALLKTLTGIPDTVLLGPEFPMVERIRNRFHKVLVVKMGGKNVASNKAEIRDRVWKLSQQPEFRQVHFLPDVDPV
ncbi:MAG: primosomal protein N' [Flavobacteriales bacterium]|nr:primosomal protein N' [Flavobacteriales bacterium]